MIQVEKAEFRPARSHDRKPLPWSLLWSLGANYETFRAPLYGSFLKYLRVRWRESALRFRAERMAIGHWDPLSSTRPGTSMAPLTTEAMKHATWAAVPCLSSLPMDRVDGLKLSCTVSPGAQTVKLLTAGLSLVTERWELLYGTTGGATVPWKRV